MIKKLCLVLTIILMFSSQVGAVTAQWDTYTDSSAIGFTVRYGDTQGGPYPYCKSIVGYTNTSLEFDSDRFLYGTTYYFVAEAYNESGPSPYSNEASYTKESYTPPEDNLTDIITVTLPSGASIIVIAE